MLKIDISRLVAFSVTGWLSVLAAAARISPPELKHSVSQENLLLDVLTLSTFRRFVGYRFLFHEYFVHFVELCLVMCVRVVVETFSLSIANFILLLATR